MCLTTLALSIGMRWTFSAVLSLHAFKSKSLSNCLYSSQVSKDFETNSRWMTYNLETVRKSLSIREATSVDPFLDFAIVNKLPEPFGIVTWNSSILMARLIDSQFGPANIFRSRKVCDLGCGVGLTSFVSAIYGADVIGLDIDEVALSLCKISYDRYLGDHFPSDDHSKNIEFRPFDMLQSTPIPYCDILLISDVTYYETLACAAAKRAFEAMQNYNAQLIVTDCGRRSTAVFSKELTLLLSQSPSQRFIPHVGTGCQFKEIQGGTFLHIA